MTTTQVGDRVVQANNPFDVSAEIYRPFFNCIQAQIFFEKVLQPLLSDDFRPLALSKTLLNDRRPSIFSWNVCSRWYTLQLGFYPACVSKGTSGYQEDSLTGSADPHRSSSIPAANETGDWLYATGGFYAARCYELNRVNRGPIHTIILTIYKPSFKNAFLRRVVGFEHS
ncbi:hypothetical protein CROQUDRAFT_95507 [Cronartium quercuum f. sp. fusiforme G11]|uniref:Uncharacterized protein n=1 Tax=Cronartium quercuum f. sp. fusiforme G11 TaxID=708437 RepID=A0A9P6T9X8_9BASI|nr:hypothetical protein CROQUDRAFT_95507 [Cronartium quercuum f. sp. fusiforme G11]